MLIQAQERLFICARDYTKKDGSAGMAVSLFDKQTDTVESYYISQSDARDYGFTACLFGDSFICDLTVSTTKFGTSVRLSDAHLAIQTKKKGGEL